MTEHQTIGPEWTIVRVLDTGIDADCAISEEPLKKFERRWPFGDDPRYNTTNLRLVRLHDTITWFQQALALVPEEYRDNAFCHDSYEQDDYGDPITCLAVSYLRPATPQEREARTEQLNRLKARRRQHELSMLARLIGEYPVEGQKLATRADELAQLHAREQIVLKLARQS